MIFREANQFIFKYTARFFQNFCIRRGVRKQFTSNEKIPDMFALRDSGNLLCVSHRSLSLANFYCGANRYSYEAKIGATEITDENFVLFVPLTCGGNFNLELEARLAKPGYQDSALVSYRICNQ
jgi:hypothetical protein